MNLLSFLILFFVFRYLKRSARPAIPNWDQLLLWANIITGLLFLIEANKGTGVLGLLWMAILTGYVYRTPELEFFRPTLVPLLPYLFLSVLEKLARWFVPKFYDEYELYFEIATFAAFVWVAATWLNLRKQEKALAVEREKRQQEEETNKVIAAQKNELEYLVEERTAELRAQKEELETTLEHLRATQDQLIQSEKMASLGELTAGIAHEIQNPLNFVNNFSEVSVELIDELREEETKDKPDTELISDLLEDLRQNLEKISHHGKRADSIVKGMLQHSRVSTGQKEETDLNALADEYLRLAYHGLRAKDKTFNAKLVTEFDPALGKANVIAQDLGRVLLNLFTNAFYAVTEKKKALGGAFEPQVSVQTRRQADGIEIRVRDNGTGMPEAVRQKIFQPFFTTKPTGQGTGLGLSLSYDIVTKGHGGTLDVRTKDGEYTEFIIHIPAS